MIKEKAAQTTPTREFEELPKTLQNYLVKAGALGHPFIQKCYMGQSGKIRSKPEQKWNSFSGRQMFSLNPLGFEWKAKSFPLSILDYVGPQHAGSRVQMLGFILMADLADDPQLFQSSWIRFLSEMVWLPTACMASCLHWRELEHNVLRVKMRVEDLVVQGKFFFGRDGWPERFEAIRFKEQMGNYSMENWELQYRDFKQHSGLKIPSQATAYWKLKSGDFEYFRLGEINSYDILV
jgi:Family of unknown function (DUF6544)